MRQIIIDAYQYQELDKTAKSFVVCWLEAYPIEEDGGKVMEYYSKEKTNEKMIAEHCNSNGYLFDRYGYPVHHIEKGRTNREEQILVLEQLIKQMENENE